MAYIFVEYPKWVTHPQTGETKVVELREEEEEFLKPIPEPESELPPPSEGGDNSLGTEMDDQEPSKKAGKK